MSDDDTPIETPIPAKVRSSRYDMRCSAHEPLAGRVAQIDERTKRIMESVSRIEARVYEGHGAQARTDSTVATVLKAVAIVIATGAALGAVATAIITLAQ